MLAALSLLPIFPACSEKPRMRVPVVTLGSKVKQPAAFHTEGCDESLLSHIYNPGRLEVIDRCIAVTGTVAKAKKENDGDYSIQLLLDKEYESLLNQNNYDYQNGALVVRIICQDSRKEECRGLNKPVTIPARGTRVRVIGAYALNHSTINAWAEIYPATSVTPVQ